MVISTQARRQVELVLTKTLVYRRYKNFSNDLSYDNQKRVGEPINYNINAQVTVQQIDSQYVKEGKLDVGDLVGLFRYEYSEDAYGTTITPTLVPTQYDEIVFITKDGTQTGKYVIQSCTPATSEDSGIIGWDFTAKLTK